MNYQPQLVRAGFQPSTVPWIRDRRCFSKQRLNFGIATVIQLRLYLLVLPRFFAKVRSFEQEIHPHTHPKQRQLPCPYYEASAKVFLTLCIYMCCKQLIGHQNCHMTCSPKKNAQKKKKVEIFESQPFFSNKNQDQHLVAFDVLFQTLFHRLPSEMDG